MNSTEVLRWFLISRAARGVSPKTVAYYHYCLDRFVARHPELPERPEALEEYLASLRLAAESKRDIFRALRTLYRFAQARHGVANAMADVAKPGGPRPKMHTLTGLQVRSLLAQPMNRRDKAMITLMLDTGIRLGELANLTTDYVGFDTITVSGKTGTREVPITAGALKALVGVDLPWQGRKGALTLNGIYLMVRRHMRAAGIKHGGPHSLRHTFARHYILAGGDAFSLQRILGHRSLSTTQIYVAMDTQDLISQHAKYSRLLDLYEAQANG